MSIVLRPIQDDQFDTLLETFNAGYEGYVVPLHLEAAQMQSHLSRYSIDLSASRFAYDGDQTVGVALMGIRGRRGWIGGIGVRSAYRGKGIGRLLMEELVNVARAHHLERVQLEVIEGNTAAQELYKKVGFKEYRRLLILDRPVGKQSIPTHKSGASSFEVQAVQTADALYYYDALHTLPNPWQREAESLEAFGTLAQGWITRHEANVDAYAIGVMSARGIGWLDMAFVPGESSAMRAILETVHTQHPELDARLVNVSETDPVYPLLTLFGYQETLAQTEMWLTLY
jgi:ribosomal protein S18 acetylase RimI-like enzyme